MESSTLVSINTWDIAKVVLGTGLLSAIISQLLNYFIQEQKVRSEKRTLAQYSAIRIAVALESYSIACAEMIYDVITYESSQGSRGKLHAQIPNSLVYSQDIEWKTIEPQLCSESLTLINEIVVGQNIVQAMKDFDCELVSATCCQQAGLYGYRSWKLASNIRGKYKLPAYSPQTTSWDIEKYLKDEHDKALAALK